jgi:ssDNA-binding Zn-finger/Zn-ribbon topoisomerase 1
MQYTQSRPAPPPQNGDPGFYLSGWCPQCYAPLVVRYARATQAPFVGCSAYPQCRFTERFHVAIEAAVADLKQAHAWAWAEVGRLQRECAYWQAQATQRSQPRHASTAHDLVRRELTQLLTLTHPDKWSAGQPAQALAHELTVALVDLRARLDGRRV